MAKTFKKVFLKLDSVLIIFSLVVSLFHFLSPGAKLIERSNNYAVFKNHNRDFLVSNEFGNLNIYDGNKKIQEIPISKDFEMSKYSCLTSNRKYNCAIVAAATAGIAFAAFIKGAGAFLSTFGLATTELEGLFAMAASGASVAEVAAAIKGALGFWALAGVVTGAAV